MSIDQASDDEHARRFEAYIEVVRGAFKPGNGVFYTTEAGGRFIVEHRGIRLALTRSGSRIDYRVTDKSGPVEHGELPDEASVRTMLGRFAGRGDASSGS